MIFAFLLRVVTCWLMPWHNLAGIQGHLVPLWAWCWEVKKISKTLVIVLYMQWYFRFFAKSYVPQNAALVGSGGLPRGLWDPPLGLGLEVSWISKKVAIVLYMLWYSCFFAVCPKMQLWWALVGCVGPQTTKSLSSVTKNLRPVHFVQVQALFTETCLTCGGRDKIAPVYLAFPCFFIVFN